MSDIDQLNERFAIQNVARFEAGNGGLPCLRVAMATCEGEIYVHGAHVTHFQPSGHKPVFFVSSRSNYVDGKPIRGGVPLIFPWFGPRADDPTAPMHGLVRTRTWDVESVTREGDGVRAAMTIATPEAQVRFVVTFAAALAMELQVRNTSTQSLRFEEALHTYFTVGDVRTITIDGLGGTEFLDKEKGHSRFRQTEPRLKLTGVTDRVYVNTPATCVIDDPGNSRRITVAKEHSASTVVWNPWDEKIKAMADLDPSEWTKYVCVETCNVKENAVTLAPGASHTLRATISVA
jgi:glucose-6-phosphate 1-epimerase